MQGISGIQYHEPAGRNGEYNPVKAVVFACGNQCDSGTGAAVVALFGTPSRSRLGTSSSSIILGHEDEGRANA